MPVAHSHQAMLGGSLELHLRRHHCCQCDAAATAVDELHWHLVLPWDATDEEGNERLPLNAHSSGCAIAGWMADAMLCQSTGDDDRMLTDGGLVSGDSLYNQIWIAAEPIDPVACRMNQDRPYAPSNLYDGATLCTLLCVSRC